MTTYSGSLLSVMKHLPSSHLSFVGLKVDLMCSWLGIIDWYSLFWLFISRLHLFVLLLFCSWHTPWYITTQLCETFEIYNQKGRLIAFVIQWSCVISWCLKCSQHMPPNWPARVSELCDDLRVLNLYLCSVLCCVLNVCNVIHSNACCHNRLFYNRTWLLK